MFGFVKKMFFRLLISIVSASNRTKRVSLSYQKCMSQPSHIYLHPNEYSQELRYYPFAVNLDTCAGSCNTLDEVSSIVCVLDETEDLHLHIF